MHELEPANLEQRINASVWDLLVFGVPCVVVWLFTTNYFHLTFVWTLVCLGLSILYSVGFQASERQATPGMFLESIYLVRAKDNGRVTSVRALLRYIVFNIVFLFFVSLLWLNPANPHNFVGKAAERYDALYMKQQRHELITREDKRFLYSAYAAVGLARKAVPISVAANGGYMLLIAWMIGYSRWKTGFHDLVCGTRVVRRLDN